MKLQYLGTAAAEGVPAFFCGCEGGGGGGGDDVGDNNKDLVVCLGDSITYGYACDGAPYLMSGREESEQVGS